MLNTIRVELPLRAPSKILNSFKTIGDLNKEYANRLHFVKYIYVDPKDGKMKGANPPNELPLVENAYITIVGSYEEVIKFTTEATKE